MKKINKFASALAFFMPLALVSSAYAAAALPQAKAYVANFKDNTLSVINLVTNKVTYTLPVPKGPDGMVITPDNRYVYLSDSGDGQVSVIDTASDSILTNIPVGNKPQGLAITPNGQSILVAVTDDNAVKVIDAQTNQITRTYPVKRPYYIAISPDSKTAYIGSQDPDHFALVVLNLSKNRIIGEIPLNNAPRIVQYSPDGKCLYFTLAGDNAIFILDLSNHQIIARMPTGASPHSLLFTHKGGLGFTATQGSGMLEVFNPRLSKVAHEIALGKLPYWIAITPNDAKAYVSNEGSNSVAVIDIPRLAKVNTIPVGKAPRQIVLVSVPQPTYRISIENYKFTPKNITVPLGTEITWANNDSVPHTIISEDPSVNSGELSSDASYSHTFNAPGAYRYFCDTHPFMIGKVIVQ